MKILNDVTWHMGGGNHVRFLCVDDPETPELKMIGIDKTMVVGYAETWADSEEPDAIWYINAPINGNALRELQLYTSVDMSYFIINSLNVTDCPKCGEKLNYRNGLIRCSSDDCDFELDQTTLD